MANCICEWWKKSMGYNFVPECNHLCQTTVCWDPEILLPWQCDIVTSPVYWLSCKQSSLDKQVWWFSRRWYIKLTFILKHCSFDVGRPQVQVPAWPLAVFVSPLPEVPPTPHLKTTVKIVNLFTFCPLQFLTLLWLKLVITEGYGGWVTTSEGPNAVKCFCSNTVLLYKFHLTDCWNMRDQIMQGRSSKRPWSNCVLCIPFILSRSPNECWLHTCSACIITTLRLGLRAPLVARKKLVSGQCLAKMTICPDEFLVCKSFWLDRFPVNGMEWFYSSCTF